MAEIAGPADADSVPALVGLAPPDDVVPVLVPESGLDRVKHLERVVYGQQQQLNGVVDLQREIVAMHAALLDRQIAIHSAHEALCEDLLSGEPLAEARRRRRRADGDEPASEPASAEAPSPGDEGGGDSAPCLADGDPAEAAAKPRGSAYFDLTGGSSPGGAERAAEGGAPRLYAVGGRAAISSGMLGGRVPQADASVRLLDTGSDSWQQVASMQTARVEHQVAVVKGSIYVTGGRSGSTALSSCERLAPEEGIWEPLRSMRTARSGHAMTPLQGSLFVTGGTGQPGSHLADCESFDLDSGRWQHAPGMSKARYGHAAVVLMQELYVVGGGSASSLEELACESFNTLGEAWTPLPPLPSPWERLSAATVENRLYVAASAASGPVAIAYWDPVDPGWGRLPPVEQLHVCTAAAGVSQRLYLLGSHHPGRGLQGYKSACLRFDPATGRWEQMPPTTEELSPCHLFAAGGSLHAVGERAPRSAARGGSRRDRGSGGGCGDAAACGLERFDAELCRWEALPPPPCPGCQVACVDRRSS